MIDINDNLKNIFQMKALTERVFFKSFEGRYNLPQGLNHTHVRTIMMLSFIKSSPMSKLSKLTILEKGSFTPVANKLIKEGYVKKIRNKEDKRVYNLELTNKGVEFAEQFVNAHVEYLNQLITSLSEEEQKDYFEAIEKINLLTKKLELQIKGDDDIEIR